VVELPPETSGALTFHLPLEVFALEHAGASAEIIEARIAEGLADAYRSGLVDPPVYRWAVEHYGPVARRLLSASAEERAAAFAEVATVGEGLAGAAFHGLIRLGYGALRRDEDEIARGLAYLRTRRQVLRGPDFGEPRAAAMPTGADLDGVTVFDQLSLAAAAGGDDLADADRALPSAAALAAGAAALVRHDASSFVSVHAMTGLHALAEVHHLVTGAPPVDRLDDSVLRSWWRAYGIALQACTLLVLATPEVGLTDCAPSFTDTPSMLAAAVASGDTHSVKLAVAMHRLVEFGVLTEATMWELVAVKLGVDECAL
jgi:hypothetical protein